MIEELSFTSAVILVVAFIAEPTVKLDSLDRIRDSRTLAGSGPPCKEPLLGCLVEQTLMPKSRSSPQESQVQICGAEETESRRFRLQEELNAEKTKAERNRLGQHDTPISLAREVLAYARTLVGTRAKLRFIDPAFGTGAFFSALLWAFPKQQILRATGYEVDSRYWKQTRALWKGTLLNLSMNDFTGVERPMCEGERFNLLVCNPPYVRHHHLSVERKEHLQKLAEELIGVQTNGFCGLYVYFMLLSHAWIAHRGLAFWVVPLEFLDSIYGKPVRDYLARQMTLLRIHVFEPTNLQFRSATVGSAIICYRKAKPMSGHIVDVTYGGSFSKPELLQKESLVRLSKAEKWGSLLRERGSSSQSSPSHVLSDFFEIKRGLATGADSYFILDGKQVTQYNLPARFLRFILPSPRHL